MKFACVTGATGCVGRNLINELLADGDWKILVLHRASSDLSRLAGLPLSFQSVDLHDLESVRAAVPTGVDALFHVAGNTSHWGAEKHIQWLDNVLATRNLVEAAIEKNVRRFIFTSTGATQEHQATDQEFAKKIKHQYMRTKRQAELEVYAGAERGLDTVILRPIIVIGAYDYNSYSQIFLNMRDAPLPLALPGRFTFCHAQDVARAHVSAYERGRRCENYVLGGPYSTWQQVFQKISDAMGMKRKVHVAPRLPLLIAAYGFVALAAVTRKKPLVTPEMVRLLTPCPDVTFYDKHKARVDLGYESRSLDTMIHDAHRWLVAEKII